MTWPWKLCSITSTSFYQLRMLQSSTRNIDSSFWRRRVSFWRECLILALAVAVRLQSCYAHFAYSKISLRSSHREERAEPREAWQTEPAPHTSPPWGVLYLWLSTTWADTYPYCCHTPFMLVCLFSAAKCILIYVSRQFNALNYFQPHGNAEIWVLLFPLYGWRNGSLEGQSNLPKVTWLIDD